MTLLAPAAAFAGGVAAWTFVEYALHAWGGHVARGRTDFSREHLAHHARADYFTPTGKKLRTALPIVGAVAGLAIGALGPGAGVALAGGFALAYAAYEVTHRRIHTHPPRGFYSAWARKHHLHHHFIRPGTNHGVTSPVWDLVFRTYERPGRVRVPPRQAPAWLLDPGTGEVRAAHGADYELAAGRAGTGRPSPGSEAGAALAG